MVVKPSQTGRRPRRTPWSLLPCEGMATRGRLQIKKLASELASAGTLILDFPASRTVKNVCCLSHPIDGILLQQPELDH